MTDEEFTKLFVNILANIKKCKSVFKQIIEYTQVHVNSSPEVEFTVIGKNELARLRNIEDKFFKISNIAKEMYKRLRGNKDEH